MASPSAALIWVIPFAIAVCPVCTPALVVLLGVTAGIGSVLLGVVLLLAFAIGRAVPIALGAFAVSWLENLKSLSRYRRGFEIAGGLTLIAMGLYMLNAVHWRCEAQASSCQMRSSWWTNGMMDQLVEISAFDA